MAGWTFPIRDGMSTQLRGNEMKFKAGWRTSLSFLQKLDALKAASIV